jgi:putative Mg2+ transporter-C (MgtC) family protein
LTGPRSSIIWNTGAIGIAVAFDRFEIAIVLGLLNLITLWVLGRLKRNVADNGQDE